MPPKPPFKEECKGFLAQTLKKARVCMECSFTAAAGARLGKAKLSVLAHSGLGLAPKKGQGIKGWQAVRPQTPSRISMALPHTGYAD